MKINIKKGGLMRPMLGMVSLSVVLFAAVLSNANAGVSVQVSVGAPAGYVSYNSCDYNDMDREDLIIINNNQVGFWVMLPSGRWVFRCRSMWYNSGYGEWCYGPWWNNYSISYNFSDPFHFFPIYKRVWFHSFMYSHYPKYWERNYGHRALPFRDRLVRDAEHMRAHDRRDRNWTPRAASGNHPTKIIETTKIITPGKTHPADYNGGLRKAVDTRKPTVSSAPVNARPQSMGKSGQGQNKTSGNRTTIRRELGKR